MRLELHVAEEARGEDALEGVVHLPGRDRLALRQVGETQDRRGFDALVALDDDAVEREALRKNAAGQADRHEKREKRGAKLPRHPCRHDALSAPCLTPRSLPVGDVSKSNGA